MALPDLEVGRVVPGRHLQRPGAELAVDRGVADDLHLPVDDRDEHLFPDDRFPARIVGMHGDRGVGHDRLGPRGRDHEVRRPGRHRLGPRVAHVAQLVGAHDVERLEIRVRRLAGEAPVHDPVGTVQVALPVHADEVDPHAALHVRIHREVHPRPIEAAAEHPELLVDARLVVVHPAPHLGEELLAGEAERRGLGPVLAPGAFLRELLLDQDLGDDPGVVRSGEPQRRLAAHAVPAGHEVLVAAEPEGMAEVQVAGHVREREHHHERLLAGRLRARREEARRLPPVVEERLDGARVEVLAAVLQDRLRCLLRCHARPPL